MLPSSKKRTELAQLLESLRETVKHPRCPDAAKIQLSEVEYEILTLNQRTVRSPKKRPPVVHFRCATEDPKCPLRQGESIMIGSADGGTEFVSIPTGKQTFVSLDDWNEHEKSRIRQDWDRDMDSRPLGSYGAVGYRDDGAFFEYRGRGSLWKPGSFRLSTDQTHFVKTPRRGHVAKENVVASRVFPHHNYASRFVERGYILVVSDSCAVAFVPGCSLSEWKRMQDYS